MQRRIHSIATVLLVTLCIGFFVPLAIGLLYSLRVERKRQETELSRFQKNAMRSLEHVMDNALLHFEPNEAQNAAMIVIEDPRVLRISVYSSLYGMFLARLQKLPVPPGALPRVERRDFVKEGEAIGYVEVVVDGAFHEAALAREQREIMLLFAAMFVCGLLLLIPTIAFKILRPVSRLMRQAETLAAGEMETPCRWTGKDELSRLGNMLETMRLTLRDSFLRIQELAVKDELTGMPNRRAFLHDAGKALDLAQRYRWPLSMALIDLDHFKQVNDTLGHAAGDQVLKEVAAVLGGIIRKTDTCARIGGEEFAVCMPETTLEQAGIVAEKIRSSLEAHAFPHGLTVTASLGLALHGPGQSLEALLREADLAMYEAKRQGRNRVVALPDALAASQPPQEG